MFLSSLRRFFFKFFSFEFDANGQGHFKRGDGLVHGPSIDGADDIAVVSTKSLFNIRLSEFRN